MAKEITFFDLPSKDPCQCWSLNPWKTRLNFNYKGIPYKTTWVEYPDIQPLLQAHVEPNESVGWMAKYTIPAVQLPDGTYVMESLRIAHEVEKLYPEPKLPVEDEMVKELEAIKIGVIKNLSSFGIPLVAQNLLRDGSMEYFRETRARRLNKPLEQALQETDREQCWKEATAGLRQLGDVLREDPDGPFVRGKQVTFADFVIVGMVHFLRRIQEDMYEKAIAIEPALGSLYDACKPWLQRGDH